MDTIKQELLESAELKQLVANTLTEVIHQVVEVVWESFVMGGKLLICGNGGSAADAQHIATELVVRMQQDRRALSAIALTTDTSLLTAAGNDLGFEHIFARQIEGLGQVGDVVLVISTSGKSPNVMRAAEVARAKGLHVVAFLGRDGGELKALADTAVIVPSQNTQRIQEVHITLGHILCGEIEKRLVQLQAS